MSYVRLLVNNTSVNENMFRFGLVDSRECECGGGIQTVEHVLMSCDIEREQREIFIIYNNSNTFEFLSKLSRNF